MTNAMFRFDMRDLPSILGGGGILFALSGNVIGGAALIVLAVLIYS